MSTKKGFSIMITTDSGDKMSYGDEINKPVQSSLLSKLKEFDDPNDSILISELNKKKKKSDKPAKRKKAVRKNSITRDIVTIDGNVMSESEYMALNNSTDDLSRLLHEDVLDAHLYDPNNVDSDEIVRNERNSHKERKNSSDKFKKEFAEDVTLLYDTLETLNGIGDDVLGQLNTYTKSRARGVTKAINDLITNAVTIQNARLATIKEITNVKKTIIDLGIKDSKNNPEVSDNDKQITASYLSMLMENRANIVGQMAGSVNTGVLEDPYSAILREDAKSREEIQEEFEAEIVDRTKTIYTDNDINDVDELMENRLESEGNPHRSSSGSKNIEFELSGIKVVVYLNALDSREWEFVAVDRDGMEVTDYDDLPDKITVGNMTFNEHYAKDSYGRVYDIIRYNPEEYDDTYEE